MAEAPERHEHFWKWTFCSVAAMTLLLVSIHLTTARESGLNGVHILERWTNDAHKFVQRTNSTDILESRSNDGNDAIPTWLGHRFGYLKGNVKNLDAKGKAVLAGERLLRALNTQGGSFFEQSPWTDTKAITNPNLYGWRYSRVAANDELLNSLNLRQAFADLSISPNPKDWYQISTNHFYTGKPNGDKGPMYPNTDATYTNIVNLKDGVAISHANWGPEWRSQKDGKEIPKEQMVPLKYTSDLFYLALQKTIDDLHTGSVKITEHAFRFNIEREEVQKHLAMVTGQSDLPTEWPGFTYPIREYQAKAALSSASGKAVAYLLGTHQAQMGVKVVDRVNIFSCQVGKEKRWCMYLHIVDGPLPEGDLT